MHLKTNLLYNQMEKECKQLMGTDIRNLEDDEWNNKQDRIVRTIDLYASISIISDYDRTALMDILEVI